MSDEKQQHIPGPWHLIWYGNEKYPYPLSIEAEEGKYWIARDGQVSSEANARLIAAAPDLLAQRDALQTDKQAAAEAAFEMGQMYAEVCKQRDALLEVAEMFYEAGRGLGPGVKLPPALHTAWLKARAVLAQATP